MWSSECRKKGMQGVRVFPLTRMYDRINTSSVRK